MPIMQIVVPHHNLAAKVKYDTEIIQNNHLNLVSRPNIGLIN